MILKPQWDLGPFQHSLKSNISTERRVAIWNSKAAEDPGLPRLMRFIHSSYSDKRINWLCRFVLKKISDSECHFIPWWRYTGVLMPTSENRKAQSLNIKSVHTYKVIKSAITSSQSFLAGKCVLQNHIFLSDICTGYLILLHVFFQSQWFPILLQERCSAIWLIEPGVEFDHRKAFRGSSKLWNIWERHAHLP